MRQNRRRRGFGGSRSAVFAAGFFALTAASTPLAAAGLVGTRASQAAPDQGAAPGAHATISAVRLDNGAESATLTFDISQDVAASAFVLANPNRVVVDLPQVEFAIAPAAGNNRPGRHRTARKAGLVDSFRFGLLMPGKSRILVDLAAPAAIVSAVVKKDGATAKLVVRLARTDQAKFQAAARQHTPQSVATPAPAAKAPAANKATVVLDPGHGGPDNGAIVAGVIEKDVALSFAKLLASKLEATGRYNVVMTRATDIFIPLSERVRIAREANANLMVSIHADTLPDTPDVSGATVYTVSDRASDAYAAQVAAKENQSDQAVGLDGQSDVADVNDILFDLTRQETRAYSHVFSRTLVSYWKIAGHLNKNPQRSAGFVVLKAPDVPSVLLELGYLSSPADTVSLVSDAWRETASTRMAEAIQAYFDERRGLPTKSVAAVLGGGETQAGLTKR